MKTEYFVINENTLGFKIGRMFQVLAGSVIRGGHNPINGAIILDPTDKIRPATKQDFADYRLDSKGCF